MKLVIFTAQVSPYHNARYVAATKYFNEVHVVSSVNAGDFSEFLATSLGDYTLHRLYVGRGEYTAAAASRELSERVRAVLEQVQPDFIAAAGWTTPENLAALVYGRERNVPIVVMSESQADDAPRSFIREVIKKRIVSKFDAALVGGPPHADYAAALGIPRERIHFGYNAVDNAHFARGGEAARTKDVQLRRDLDLPERYILASARFIKKKNLPNLVLAYSEARRRIRDAPDLVILGDGPERPEVERAISESGVASHICLPGFRGYDLLPAFYALSEGFVHVSASEQWGLVINEAMASGVPVVVSNRCGATRAVVEHGVSGLVTDTDVGAISEALIALFRLSPEARQTMGRAAADAISAWGPDRFGAGMRAAVDTALAARRRGPISLFDRLLFKRLERRIIATVS